MKALLKVILLLVLIGLIVFGLWKAVDATLFADEDTALPPSAQLIKNTHPSPQEPQEITQDQAFESTSDDSPLVSEEQFTCKDADKIITALYDMRLSHKSYEQAAEFIQNEPSIPSSQIDPFLELAHGWWDMPIEKLGNRDSVKAHFEEQCKKVTH